MSTDKAERPRFAKRSEVETWSREASNIRPFCRKLAKMPNVRQLHSARCRRLTWSTVERHERQPCNAGCRYITLHNIESAKRHEAQLRSVGYRRATWGVVEGRDEAQPRGARCESAGGGAGARIKRHQLGALPQEPSNTLWELRANCEGTVNRKIGSCTGCR